jgi:hypothetical protein
MRFTDANTEKIIAVQARELKSSLFIADIKHP